MRSWQKERNKPPFLEMEAVIDVKIPQVVECKTLVIRHPLQLLPVEKTAAKRWANIDLMYVLLVMAEVVVTEWV